MPILVYVFYFLYLIYTYTYFKNRKAGKPAEFWLDKVTEDNSEGFKAFVDFGVGALFLFATACLIYRTIFPLPQQ